MDNPYAPPQSNLTPQPSNGVLSIDGKALVVPKDLTFPAICIKTGSVTNLAPLQKRRLIWCPPAVALLLFLPIVFIVVVPFFLKRGTVYFYVTEEVALRRRRSLRRNWGLLFAAISCFATMAVFPNDVIVYAWFAGVVCFLSSMICGAIAGRFLQARKVTATHIHILGIPSDIQQRLMELCANGVVTQRPLSENK